MRLLCADFKINITTNSEYYRMLDPYFKDHFVPFRNDFQGINLNSLSMESSSLCGDLDTSDVDNT